MLGHRRALSVLGLAQIASEALPNYSLPPIPANQNWNAAMSRAELASLEPAIEQAWKVRDTITPETGGGARAAIESVLEALDNGAVRVAERQPDGQWHVNQWAKKAVLLGFRLRDMGQQSGGPQGGGWWDKVDSKFEGWTEHDWRAARFRAVPSAVVRRSAYIAPNVVLMPSFVNVGAYVGEGTMVDTWASVGSCAQIGRHVHLSGGVGIGGVLEPMQAGPTIIEDNCFIGARSEVVEGCIVREGSVLGMGVFIGQSTKSSIARPARFSMARCRPIRWWWRGRCRASRSRTAARAPASIAR